jgi:hypothetical protein
MLSSSDIKRQIIEQAPKLRMGTEAKIESGITEGDILELGNSLEAMTKVAGWAVVEDFMLKRMNLVNMAISDNLNDVQRGIARGYIELMQMVQNRIKEKNIIEEREKLKHEKPSQEKDIGKGSRQTEDVSV